MIRAKGRASSSRSVSIYPNMCVCCSEYIKYTAEGV